jgi:hypothetical protein
MEEEQMMAHLLAEIRSNRKKMDTNQAAMTANQDILKEEMLAKMEANQEKKDAKIDANQDGSQDSCK